MGGREARARHVKMTHINPVEAYDVRSLRNPSNWVEKLAIHRPYLLPHLSQKIVERLVPRNLTPKSCVLHIIMYYCSQLHTNVNVMAGSNKMEMYMKRFWRAKKKAKSSLEFDCMKFSWPIRHSNRFQVLFQSRKNSCDGCQWRRMEVLRR